MISWSQIIIWTSGVVGFVKFFYQSCLKLARLSVEDAPETIKISFAEFSGGRHSRNFNGFHANPREKIVQTIIDYINSAQKSIYLAMNIFTHIEICQAIIRAYERGVDVKAISENSMFGSSGSQFKMLLDAGIPVYWDPLSNNDSETSSIMHNKFCLIDTEWLFSHCSANENRRNVFRSKNLGKSDVKYIPENGIVLSGSVNWTMQGFLGNFDNLIISSSDGLIVPFQKEFENICHSFKLVGNRDNT